MPNTLINPANGHLAFKVYSLHNHDHFDHLQRLNYYTLILLHEGKGELLVDFSSYTFEAKHLFAFAPYQPFLFKPEGMFNGEVIHFHPDFFCIHKHHSEVACNGVLFNNIYKPPYILIQPEEETRLLKLIGELKEEMGRPDLAQSELLISYLKIFLIHCARIKLAEKPIEVKMAGNPEEPLVLQNLKDAIEIHYKEKHSVNEYAELLKIPSKTLAKMSKRNFNRTISDLITERIVIEAKRELYLTSKPIKNIAFDLGFQDEHYFSRYFKNKTETSPQLYRETVGFARGEA